MSGSQQSAGRHVKPGPVADDTVRYKREAGAVRAVADVFKSIADDASLSDSEKIAAIQECIVDANSFLTTAA